MEKHTISVKDSVVFGTHQGSSIIWIVLDVQDTSALILSDISVRVSAYHNRSGTVSWHQSELRKWLNHDFYQSAFTPEEQKEIVDVQFSDTEEEQIFSQDAFDHIFLLSKEEAKRYFSTDEERTLTSPWEDIVGMLQGWNGLRSTCCWWLRGNSIQGDNCSYAPACDINGSYDCLLNASKARAGVRPAAWVHLSALRHAEQPAHKPPLLGLLKSEPLGSVIDFSGEWPNERRVLGSFVDYENSQQYLLIQSDSTSLYGDVPFFARLAMEPVDDQHTDRKLQAVAELLSKKPYSRAASELWMDLCRYLVAESMKQRAWMSNGDDACPELQESSEFKLGHDFATEDHQPYRWKILKRKGNKALVICQQGLFYDVFADDENDISMTDEDTSNVWQCSRIRKWLNNAFFNQAFTKDEQSMIVRYQTESGDFLGRPDPGKPSVFDRCFLLSIAEATVFFSNDQERQLTQALDSKLWNRCRNTGTVFETHNWWCRSRGCRNGFVACVDSSGAVNPQGASADTEECVVRPALLIDLERLACQNNHDIII